MTFPLNNPPARTTTVERECHARAFRCRKLTASLREGDIALRT